jgi:putative oxidoreductase
VEGTGGIIGAVKDSPVAMLNDLIRLFARLCLAALFIYEGVWIVLHYSTAEAYAITHGVASWLLPFVAALQVAGGLLVVIGWQAKLFALGLAGFCFLTALFFHFDFSKTDEIIQFGKDIALAGGFLMLFACGPGRYALGGGD